MGSLSSRIVEREIATMRQVEEALARQVLYGADLATNLLEVLGKESEAAITYVLAEHFALRPAPAGPLPAPSAEALERVPHDLAARYGFCVIGAEGASLVIAVAEPLARTVEEELSTSLGVSLVQMAAPLVRVRQALARDYGHALDRRSARMLSKLDDVPDPHPSTAPPPGMGTAAFHAPRFPRAFSEEPRTRPGMGSSRASRPPEPPAEVEPSGAPAKRLVRWIQRTSQGASLPRARRRRGPMTAGAAEESLTEMSTAEDALAVFFDFAQQYFTYSALFVVHGDLAEGRDSYGPGAPRDQVAGIGVPLDLPSVLSLARSRGRA
jgi:hypothetical protein